MADTKLKDLTATTTPALADLAYLVVDPSGTPLDRKVTLANLQALLSDQVRIAENLLGADASSVSFTSIPGTYRHLKLVVMARTTEAVTDNYAYIQFNGDTGSNYDFGATLSYGGGLSFSGNFAQTKIRIGDIAGANAASADDVGICEVLIPAYSLTTFRKLCQTQNFTAVDTSGNTLLQVLCGGRWRSTAAITRVDILPSANDFKAGSLFSLYGLK